MEFLVLFLCGLCLQTFQDEKYIPGEQGESWYSRICMFFWWVFMLDQKAVCMPFEDWLECKTSHCASLECQRSESFLRGGSSSPTVILQRIAHRLFVSRRLLRPCTIVISLKRPDKLFQSQKLKVPHRSFSTNPPVRVFVIPQKKLFRWFTDTVANQTKAIVILNIIVCHLKRPSDKASDKQNRRKRNK